MTAGGRELTAVKGGRRCRACPQRQHTRNFEAMLGRTPETPARGQVSLHLGVLRGGSRPLLCKTWGPGDGPTGRGPSITRGPAAGTCCSTVWCWRRAGVSLFTYLPAGTQALCPLPGNCVRIQKKVEIEEEQQKEGEKEGRKKGSGVAKASPPSWPQGCSLFPQEAQDSGLLIYSGKQKRVWKSS